MITEDAALTVDPASLCAPLFSVVAVVRLAASMATVGVRAARVSEQRTGRREYNDNESKGNKGSDHAQHPIEIPVVNYTTGIICLPWITGLLTVTMCCVKQNQRSAGCDMLAPWSRSSCICVSAPPAKVVAGLGLRPSRRPSAATSPIVKARGDARWAESRARPEHGHPGGPSGLSERAGLDSGTKNCEV